jgi:hypothetical protein
MIIFGFERKSVGKVTLSPRAGIDGYLHPPYAAKS